MPPKLKFWWCHCSSVFKCSSNWAVIIVIYIFVQSIFSCDTLNPTLKDTCLTATLSAGFSLLLHTTINELIMKKHWLVGEGIGPLLRGCQLWVAAAVITCDSQQGHLVGLENKLLEYLVCQFPKDLGVLVRPCLVLLITNWTFWLLFRMCIIELNIFYVSSSEWLQVNVKISFHNSNRSLIS